MKKAIIFYAIVFILLLVCVAYLRRDGDPSPRPEYQGSPMMEAKNYEYYTGH